MAEAVYILCALASIACGVMLFRGFAATRTRLLLWSGLCFLGLALNNVLLFLDLVLIPTVDLSLARSVLAVVSVAVLLFGLIWESK